ncbi:flavin reductase family protein [Jongsikchunia kroppenstedtii]|uniref:flavin reductase family protein n=1 Tax=Jongsikchunia kroppenstedtii TaxID=1121721 RepID=UPI000382B961|nr:flavin reductase family protein [Jongsikchunia kroppenstedtii]
MTTSTASAIDDLLAAPSDSAGLRKAFAHFPNGLVAIAARVDGRPHGLVVASFVPVSIDPPLVSVCVQHSSTTWPRLQQARSIGISLLGHDQHRTAYALGGKGDRFAEVDVHDGRDGAIFVGGAAAWIETTIHAEIPAGDHRVVLLRVDRIAGSAEAEPLVFHGSSLRRLAAAD